MPAILSDRSHLPQVRSMNHRHEAILTWLLLNPHRTLEECARELGYTRSWLSLVIHSDMFQAVYRAECERRNEVAVHTITAKLSQLTVRAIEKAHERIEAGTASERFLAETQKNSLAALGFGSRPSAGEAQKHLHVHVDAQTLMAARERAATFHRGASRADVQRTSDPAAIDTDTQGVSGPPENVIEMVPAQMQLGLGLEPAPCANFESPEDGESAFDILGLNTPQPSEALIGA